MADEKTVPEASKYSRTAMISPPRVWTIATSTFTQLLRMKALYFLLVIILMIAIFGNLDIFNDRTEQVASIKKMSFGIMDWFAWIFAIVSTAVLIPRDLEDRTLYTILSKPVMRIEYLLGKFVGVMLLIGFALIALFTVLSVILYVRTEAFVAAEAGYMAASGVGQAEIDLNSQLIRKFGFRLELSLAVLAIFVKAMVVTAVTLCISTFASSSLFTIIVSGILFMVGNAITMMTSFWEDLGGSAVKVVTSPLKIFIPDYQIFAFSEGIVLGETVVPTLIWQMTGLGLFYCVFYILLSLLVFYDKEF